MVAVSERSVRPGGPHHERTIFSGACELTDAFQLPARPQTASGKPYDEARLLVRLGGEPIGFVTLPLRTEPLSQATVIQAVRRDLHAQLTAELTRQDCAGEEPLSYDGAGLVSQHSLELRKRTAISVSVVVCTRNRAQVLADCLHSLRALDHDSLEFVIVDNAPGDDSTRDLVSALAREDPRFNYIREPQAGLSRARNRGLTHASGDVVAYTDDDVRVDPLWIKALLRGFARRSDVGCVTGMVASASLELPSEQYFDRRVWWSSTCEACVYDAQNGPAGSALHPYAAGKFGTGANFAVRTELLRKIGEFDECLGAGSPCDGGEDLDIFVRFIRAGYSISYEPAALVWHEHRSDPEALRRQMYAYGKSLSAYVFKYASSPSTAVDVLRRLPHGLRYLGLLSVRSRRAGSAAGMASEPAVAEMRGLIAGPAAYLRARRAQEPERRRAVAP